MNRPFLDLILEKTGFPLEARDELRRVAELISEQGLDEAVDFFFDCGYNIEQTQTRIDRLASNTGVSEYSVWMVLLLLSAERVKPLYDRFNVGDQIFWDTFADLKFKAVECKEIHDVWGTFVAFWYPIFYRGDIVKLGCLEFENNHYYFDNDYCFGDIVVKKGDAVKSIHIPSSGEPFNAEARLDSYRRAYELFKNDLGDRPLICICDSWLLYPEYKRLLPQGSNILSFMNELKVVDSHDSEDFGDAWRVFGREHKNPSHLLPERTSLQRIFKQHLINGGKVGSGKAVLIFDGERIVNR